MRQKTGGVFFFFACVFCLAYSRALMKFVLFFFSVFVGCFCWLKAEGGFGEKVSVLL